MFLEAFKNTETKNQETLESKSADGWRSLNDLLICDTRTFNSLGLGSLSAQLAWGYYECISPIFHAANLIAKSVAQISPVIWDKEDKQYIVEYDSSIPATEILNLLDQPNFDDIGRTFIEKMAISYIITGNIFLVATGDVKKPPHELFYFGTQYLDIQSSNRDQYPATYRIEQEYTNLRFDRDEKEFRFYNKFDNQEIWQIKKFNPYYNASDLFGLSPIKAVYYEMEQYKEGNIHNLSLLEKGARPSGLLMMNGVFNPEMKDKLKQQFTKYYQGSQNAGNVVVAEGGAGGQVDFKELSISNKDMDFATLKEMAEDNIYRTLGIPASFYDNSASTFNNKRTDKDSLYDLNVLPLTEMLYNEINNFLMPRYDDSGRYELAFIEKDIPALKDRYFDLIDRKIKAGTYSKDEIRGMYGDAELESGGDDIVQPQNLVTVGTAPEMKQELDTSYDEYKSIMQKQTDNDGKRIYTDEQIDEFAKKNGLLEVEKKCHCCD